MCVCVDALQDVAYLDLCSHPTLPASDRVYTQRDDDSDDGDNASICSSQVIYRFIFHIESLAMFVVTAIFR